MTILVVEYLESEGFHWNCLCVNCGALQSCFHVNTMKTHAQLHGFPGINLKRLRVNEALEVHTVQYEPISQAILYLWLQKTF